MAMPNGTALAVGARSVASAYKGSACYGTAERAYYLVLLTKRRSAFIRTKSVVVTIPTRTPRSTTGYPLTPSASNRCSNSGRVVVEVMVLTESRITSAMVKPLALVFKVLTCYEKIELRLKAKSVVLGANQLPGKPVFWQAATNRNRRLAHRGQATVRRLTSANNRTFHRCRPTGLNEIAGQVEAGQGGR